MSTMNELLAINACIVTGGHVDDCRKAKEFSDEAKELQEMGITNLGDLE